MADTTLGPNSKITLTTATALISASVGVLALFQAINRKLDRMENHMINDWTLMHQVLFVERLKMNTNLYVPDPTIIMRDLNQVGRLQ